MQVPSTLGILAEGYETEKIPANISAKKKPLTKKKSPNSLIKN